MNILFVITYVTMMTLKNINVFHPQSILVEKSALKEELSLAHNKLVETETKIKRNENRINKSHKSIAKNNQAIRKNQQLRLNDQKDFRIRMEHINIKQQV